MKMLMLVLLLLITNSLRIAKTISISSSICAYEKISLEFEEPVSKVIIEVIANSSAQIVYREHIALRTMPISKLCTSQNNVLVTNYGHTIQLIFDHETEMPQIDSMEELLFHFSFSQALPSYTQLQQAHWLSTTELLVDFNEAPSDINVQLNCNQSMVYSGQYQLRLDRPGLYTIQTSDTTGLILQSLEVHVEECPDIRLIQVGTNKVAPPTPTIPVPIVRYKGPLGISGTETIRLAHDALPCLASGSFSISLWLRLLEPLTGEYRTLFYKGNDQGQRTPSVWLLPHSNRFAIRVSTAADLDIGADSFTEIPINVWTNLVFTFTRIVSDKSKYRITLYVNGAKDIALDYEDPVILNHEPLHLFNDPTHRGPKCFVSDLILWDNTLIPSDILRLAHASLDASAVAGIDSAFLLLQDTPLLHKKLSIPQATPIVDGIDGINAYIGPTRYTAIGLDSMDPVALEVLNKARSGVDCSMASEDPSALDIFADAAQMGSAEALLIWANMKAFGYESPTRKCAFTLKKQVVTHKENLFTDQMQAIVGFVAALAMGEAAALVPFTTLLQFGVGLPRNMSISSLLDSVPLHESLRSDLLADGSILSQLLKLTNLAQHSCSKSSLTILCPITPYLHTSNQTPHTASVQTDEVTGLITGLLLLASIFNDDEARAILSYQFEQGVGVSLDIETAAFYSLSAAKQASLDFHSVGGEPIMEADRLNDDTEKAVFVGNQGTEDVLIQHQLVRAKEGHIPSLLAMADLYYYGAHGVPRDQNQARQFFHDAGSLGSVEGLCGAAGMALKGEGGDKNLTEAIQLYETAAAQGSIRALNGLGYLYFFGQEIPKNETKAYEYFLQAALSQKDGDSLFNAGFCLLHGRGVDKSIPFAKELFSIAANKFGHFDSVFTLGTLLYEGDSSGRSVTSAMRYIKAATSIGAYHGWIRRGLDNYMNGVYDKALLCYLRASALGYEVAQGNAAFIIKRKLSRESPSISISTAIYDAITKSAASTSPAIHPWDSTLLARLQTRLFLASAEHGNKDSMVFVGHAYHEGIGVEGNLAEALWWYTRASSKGQPLGSFYVGIIHHFGLKTKQNIPHAIRYYEYALSRGELQPVFRTITKTLLYLAKSRMGNTILPYVSRSFEQIIQYCLSFT